MSYIRINIFNNGTIISLSYKQEDKKGAFKFFRKYDVHESSDSVKKGLWKEIKEDAVKRIKEDKRFTDAVIATPKELQVSSVGDFIKINIGSGDEITCFKVGESLKDKVYKEVNKQISLRGKVK